MISRRPGTGYAENWERVFGKKPPIKGCCEALKCYGEAMFLGNQNRDEAIQKIRAGIACFASPELAMQDAEESIARYTKSDFSLAYFYELVHAEALLAKLLNTPLEVQWEREPS